MSASVTTPKFPSAIEVKLRSVRWRHALLTAARALTAAVCVLVALMMLSMFIDWAFPFADIFLRVVLTIATLIVSVVTLVTLGLNPIRAALGWNRAATAVDDEIPQLEERWSTVASLANQKSSHQTATQRAMAEQVTSEAIAMERIVQPSQVSAPVSLRPALFAAAGCMVFLAALYVMMPAQLSILLARFWSPTSTITATQLTSLTGDQLVPRGEKIELVTELEGLRRSGATLTILGAEGDEQTYSLRPDAESPNTFLHTMRVDDSLRYRVRSGDGQTSWHELQAIDYPEVAEIEFEIDFPEYTGRESVLRDRIPRRVKVIQGSRLALAIRPLEQLKQLSISITTPEKAHDEKSDDEQVSKQVHQLTADDDGWYRFEMQLLDDVLLEPALLSEHGLKNLRRLFSRIDVIADKAPVARVVSPTDEMAVAVDETIEIEFEAHDDHGIAKAELVVYDESQKDADGNPKIVEVKEIPLGDQQMQKHVMGKTTLDLKELNVAEGSEISYAVRVTDNRDVPASDGEMDFSPQLATNDHSENETEQESGSRDQEGQGTQQKTANGDARPEQSLAAKDSLSESDSTDDQLNDMMTLVPKDDSYDDNTASKSADVEKSDDASIKDDVGTDEPTESANATSDKLAANDLESTEQPESMPNDPSKSGDPKSGEPNSESTSDASSLAIGDAKPKNDPNSADSSNDPQAAKTGDPNDESSEQSPNPDAVAKTGDNAKQETESNIADNKSDSGKQSNANSNPSGDKKDQEKNDQTDDVKVASNDRPPNTDEETNANRRDDRMERDEQPNSNKRNSAQSSLANASKGSPNQTDQPPRKFAMKGQQSRSGQNTLTGRRRLKITERLAAIAEADDLPGEELEVRKNVVEIDKMLAQIETGLRQLVDRKIADADRGEQFSRLDEGLGNVETYIADLREQTKENRYAFVGLQMVDIARTHVTPARDRAFAAIQRPNASDADAAASLQHVVRARELLGALLERYDRVAREEKMQRALDETVTMYEVYIEKRRTLMRESRQNLNPLERKMAVIEVDQEYLDRLAEVLKLRREMMDGFAQMLGDDPRLLSRYLELIKRRGKSLRARLTEISQRQYDATEETLGWLQIDESQKQDLWTIIVELRLHTATQLAKDAAQLAERIEKQMPLEVDAKTGTPAEVIRQAKQIDSLARIVSFDAEKLNAEAGEVVDRTTFVGHARSLVAGFQRLSASLDRLQFENEIAAINDYVDSRILETRAVADQADAWLILSESLADHSYAGIVKTEQHQLAFETQILRVEMLEMKGELNGQFQQLAETDLPDEIAAMIEQLHHLMESITFNQAAAAFRAGSKLMESAGGQQQLATERLERAEKLFDKVRRAVVEALDEYDVRDPNIADLRDPTLDDFLARLEREPNIARQLGIPNRRRNLRVIADSVFQQQNGGGDLGDSGEAAAARAKKAMKMTRNEKKKKEAKEQTKEDQEQQAKEKKAQEMLEKSLVEMEKRMKDPETSEGQRERLKKMAKDVKEVIEQGESNDTDRCAWQRMVQSDQASALLQAIARGETVADDQWNKLLSTLDDGLWQVRGKQPPEAYRKAIEQYQDQIRELMQTINE